MRASEPLYVYVDEAGDRGWGSRSSPVFVLAATVVRARDEPALAAVLDKINVQLGRQYANPLHWSENVRRHDERKFVARELAELPATVTAVVLHKESLRGKAPGLTKPDDLYRYMIRRLFERVSWYARAERAQAMVRLAHVRRFKYHELDNYLDHLRKLQTTIDWGSFRSHYPRVDQPHNIRALQVADLVAGCVYAAFKQDRFGAFEPEYLKTIAPLLWIGSTRKLHTYGLQMMGTPNCRTSYDWWDEVADLAGRYAES